MDGVDDDNSSIVPWERRKRIVLIVNQMEFDCAKRQKKMMIIVGTTSDSIDVFTRR